MKESEAKKKLCPFNNAHQAVGSVSISVNTYCKGSDCMMWEAELEPEPELVEKEVKKETMYASYKLSAPEGFDFYNLSNDKKPEKENNVIAKFRRFIDSDSGDCGLKPKELYCEGCNQ